MQNSTTDNAIQNYLDSLYVISHSGSTIHIYRSAINHFKKFVQNRYSKSLDTVISELKNNPLANLMKNRVCHVFGIADNWYCIIYTGLLSKFCNIFKFQDHH